MFFKKNFVAHQDPPFATIDRQGKIVVLALTLANVNTRATQWL